jgi:hypothetical protein
MHEICLMTPHNPVFVQAFAMSAFPNFTVHSFRHVQ